MYTQHNVFCILYYGVWQNNVGKHRAVPGLSLWEGEDLRNIQIIKFEKEFFHKNLERHIFTREFYIIYSIWILNNSNNTFLKNIQLRIKLKVQHIRCEYFRILG